MTQQKKLIALRLLFGLDSKFVVVCSQILSSWQVDTFTDVFFWVMQSSFEGSRSTLKGDSLDRSALVVQSRGHGHGRGGGRGGQVTCYGCE